MLLRVRFEDPLTVNVNVTITQKEDDRVAKLEKQMDEWLATLKQNTDSLETVSKQVDSTKNSL